MCNKFVSIISLTVSIMITTAITASEQVSICGNPNVCFSGGALQQPINLCPVGISDGDTVSWTVNGAPFNETILSYTPTRAGAIDVVLFVNGTAVDAFQGFASLPPTINALDQCVCIGGDLTFSITASPSDQNACCTQNSALLLVTGPDCFSFSGFIPVDGTTIVNVDVTQFATPLQAGCYFATLIDQFGCVVANQQIRAIIVPCPCPSPN
jgi:hypothetical protein